MLFVVPAVVVAVLLSPLVGLVGSSPVARPSPGVASIGTPAAAFLTRPLGDVAPAMLSTGNQGPATLGPRPSVSTSVVVGKHFPGLSFANNTCGCVPPDVQVAVGPGYVVEMINTEGKIWTKAGVVVTSFSLGPFFLTGTNFISDPKILYDNVSGRWFASILNVSAFTSTGTAATQVAVSTSSDPTKTWDVYSIPGGPAHDFADQPILGVSNGLVAIGGNEFGIVSQAFVGSELFALNKTAMIHGLTTFYTTFGPYSTRISMHPVHSISSTGIEYVVMTTGSSTVDLFKLTGSPSSTTVAHLSAAIALSVASFSTPPAAPQKGTSFLVDTSDVRVQDAVWKTNTLWLTFNTGCVPSGDISTRSCVRLVEITTGSTNTVTQSFNLAHSQRYFFYGALALDGGSNLTVVWGWSNGTTYPTLSVTAHLSTGAHGSTLPWVTLVRGTASVTVGCTGGVCRWGDYYGAGADPKTQNIWVAGEYVITATYFSTWIAQVRP